jgi:ankyrin repeat protein
MVELLLERGADPEAVEDNGATPLQLALKNGHTGVAEVLRARGATSQGETDNERK